MMTRLPLLALVALLTPALAARAQAQSAAEVQEMSALQELMAAALNEFSGAQQSRSIVQWDELVTRLEALRRQAPLSPRAKDFRVLIQLQPQHSLSKERVSPKVVDFFNNIKKDLVGFLAVQSKPAGAKVSLNGEFLSLTDFFPLEVLAGSYQVEVTREGYKTETRDVTIAPKATETLEVDLVRTLARFAFVTEPAGVEIWMDGELRATTSGTLAPDQHE